MSELELYAQQMKHWFDEQDRIRQQIERTIQHYDELSRSNQEQLALHVKRIDIGRDEYNIWAEEHGFPLSPRF